jgi:hypothetical protein
VKYHPQENNMKFALRYCLTAVLVAAAALWGTRAVADSDARHHSNGWDEQATGLVREVLESTRRFRDVTVAEAEQYGAFLGCVSGPQEGAMGVHFVNGGLVEDGLLDAALPEILVYEPRKNGSMRLVAVEYIVIAEAWDAVNPNPPALSGQVFHYSGSPNRYGLPPFYALHVWAWKDNPHGMFVDWNPKVSCENFTPAP